MAHTLELLSGVYVFCASGRGGDNLSGLWQSKVSIKGGLSP